MYLTFPHPPRILSKLNGCWELEVKSETWAWREHGVGTRVVNALWESYTHFLHLDEHRGYIVNRKVNENQDPLGLEGQVAVDLSPTRCG